MAELTATLIVNRSDSQCSHCGEPTLVTGVTHHVDVSGWAPEPGGGCGARFVDIAAGHGAVSRERLREMRPDLPVRDDTE